MALLIQRMTMSTVRKRCVQGSGRYPHLQEPGKSAKSTVQSTPGNHAYPPTGGADASNSSKTSSAATPKDASATATNPSNHAYPPTAGASSSAKPSQSTSGGTSSKSAGSSNTYTPQGKDFKADQAGISKDKSGSGSLPVSQGQSQSKSPPAHLPGGSSSKPGPGTAGAAGNHAYPPTAGASASSSGRGPPPSGQPPPEPLPGGRNKWRLHPYLPIDVRLLTAALLGLGAYYFYFPPATSDHQPNAGDGRVFGSPDSEEPDPKQLDDPEGEPIPLDMDAVAKHARRLDQRSNSNSNGKGGEQHQPNASDGRVLGSSDSHEPPPKQNDGDEPLPFDEGAAAKHAKRLQQHSKEGEGAEQHQPNAGDGRVLGSSDSHEPAPELRHDGEPLPFDDSAVAQHAKRLGGDSKQQHQPNAGDGRVFGSPNSREPNPEELDNGERLPTDDSAAAKHAQRLAQRSNQHHSPEAEQHQPNAGDGRVLGSEQSREPKPEQPLPLDLDAVDKHQQRLEAAKGQQGGSQHQPRAGDGRKMGSPDSREPEPVVLDNGEPMPVDKEAVARHQRRLEERVKQDQARHENAHDDEFAISGGVGDKPSGDAKAGKDKGKGTNDGKPVYVDPTPLAALFQEALGGSSEHTDQPRKSPASHEMNKDDPVDGVKKTAQRGVDSVAQKAEEAKDASVDGSKSAKAGAQSAGQKAEEVKESAKASADSAADSAKSGVKSAKQKTEEVKESAKESADSAKSGVKTAANKAEDVRDSAKSGAKSATDSVKAGASTARQKAEEMKDSAKASADSAADSAKSGVESAKQKAEDVTDSAKSGAKSAADSVKAGASTARQKAEETQQSLASSQQSRKQKR
ncbi:hypothetical protein ABBQ38_008671 [Trebouxia sp. C0009 RCD-2024]